MPYSGTATPEIEVDYNMQRIPIANGITSALEPVRTVLKPILSNPTFLAVWGLLIIVCVGVLWWDIRNRNQPLPSMMKFVWTLVVAYSGPFGLAVYWFSGSDPDFPRLAVATWLSLHVPLLLRVWCR